MYRKRKYNLEVVRSLDQNILQFQQLGSNIRNKIGSPCNLIDSYFLLISLSFLTVKSTSLVNALKIVFDIHSVICEIYFCSRHFSNTFGISAICSLGICPSRILCVSVSTEWKQKVFLVNLEIY